MQPGRIVLASRSPRRRQLLTAAGYDFEIRPAAETAECGACSRESPAQLVQRLAYQKAADIAGQVDRGIVLACDTVAEIDGQILGKPPNVQFAERMLRLLRGREHRVLSGVCLWPRPEGSPVTQVAITRLRMDEVSEADLGAYLESGLWEGKAGAFGYQDGLDWLHVVEGSESNVVGLPMELLAQMIDRLSNRETKRPGQA